MTTETVVAFLLAANLVGIVMNAMRLAQLRRSEQRMWERMRELNARLTAHEPRTPWER